MKPKGFEICDFNILNADPSRLDPCLPGAKLKRVFNYRLNNARKGKSLFLDLSVKILD